MNVRETIEAECQAWATYAEELAGRHGTVIPPINWTRHELPPTIDAVAGWCRSYALRGTEAVIDVASGCVHTRELGDQQTPGAARIESDESLSAADFLIAARQAFGEFLEAACAAKRFAAVPAKIDPNDGRIRECVQHVSDLLDPAVRVVIGVAAHGKSWSSAEVDGGRVEVMRDAAMRFLRIYGRRPIGETANLPVPLSQLHSRTVAAQGY